MVSRPITAAQGNSSEFAQVFGDEAGGKADVAGGCEREQALFVLIGQVEAGFAHDDLDRLGENLPGVAEVMVKRSVVVYSGFGLRAGTSVISTGSPGLRILTRNSLGVSVTMSTV